MDTKQLIGAEEIVRGFHAFVSNPYAVRLDPRLYDRESFALDRNTIRRQTRLFNNEWNKLTLAIRAGNHEDVAAALIEAGRWSFSGRLSWSYERQAWEYCAGQYQPTEIRTAGYRVVQSAIRILYS